MAVAGLVTHRSALVSTTATGGNANYRKMGRASPHPSSHGRDSPAPGLTLTKTHMLDAIAHSSDDGGTLDFSNKNLVEVTESGAEELAQLGRDDVLDECRILRIALVGNRLASLPSTFSLLTRLRYLTLRSNSFTVFPEVLTTMPSLEILDFSRNKLRRLPENPGSLVHLRVLAISKNKIRRLPSYLAKFESLTVLKADHNPIEWPPSDVMEMDDDAEDPDIMNRWVEQLKDWLGENAPDEDETMSQVSYSSTSQIGDNPRIDAGVTPTPHARTFSVDSETSIYTASSYTNSIEGGIQGMPTAIDTVNVSPTIPTGLSDSPESYLPTPDDSIDDDGVSIVANLQHGRNRSYAIERQTRLAGQKSLPDLRRTRVNFVPQERPIPAGVPMPTTSKQPSSESLSSQAGPSTSPSDTAPLKVRPRLPRQGHEPTPSTSERKAPSMDFERNSYFRRLSTLPVSKISRTISPALLSAIDSVRGILFAVSQIYQSLQHYTVYAIDERLSSVLLKVLDPASANMIDLISALDKFDMMSRTGCPPPQVCRRVVECCRDNVAMFGKAVSVLALQLKMLASRDDVRYSRHMLLMLYGAMAEISKAWADIAPQLEAIEPLLQGERERTFMTPSKRSPSPSPGASSMAMNSMPMGFMPMYKMHYGSQTSSGRIQIPPIAEQPEPSTSSTPPAPDLALPQAMPLSRTRSAQPLVNRANTANAVPSAPPMKRPSVSEGRQGGLRTSRRHAGSFSVKDVEIGANMPSNSESSPPAGGVASGSSTPTPRSTINLPRILPVPVPPLPSSTTSIHPPFPLPTAHSRQGSAQNGSTPAGLAPVLLAGPSRNNHDAPKASNTLVDKEAIDAMAGAVHTATNVWSMLEEISGEMQDSPADLRDSLARAKTVTQRLGENIKAIQEGDPNADRKALREDAHVFVKTVISLSKVVKDHGTAHQIASQLRSDIAKLTNATQEFVMLLHVSSFSHSSTPRPYSPMPNGATLGGLTPGSNGQTGLLSSLIAEEKQHIGGANLSRSRSAQPSASSKLAAVSTTAAPRSALPHQSFKIPVLPARTTGR